MTDGSVWWEQAVCARLDTLDADRLFFGVEAAGGQRFMPGGVQAARQVCEGCPVWYDCLLAALQVPTAHDRHGIRAGFTPAERADLRDGDEHDHGPHAGSRCFWVGGPPDGARQPRTPPRWAQPVTQP